MAGEETDGAPQPEGKKRSTLFVCAIVAAVLFVLGLCLVGILATLLMPALLKAKMRANEVKCANNLKQIALGAMQYADENRSYPYDPTDPTGKKGFDLLVEKHLVDDPTVFMCPADESPYEGFAFPLTVTSLPSSPLAWDKNPHPDGTRNVVFLDAHTQRMPEAEFASLLEEIKKRAESRKR